MLWVESAILYWVVGKVGLFELFQSQWINIGLLFAVGLLYLGVFLVLLRFLRLLRSSDVEGFQSLEIGLLNRIIRLFVV